ncbi:type II toxin-antitoxin system RelE/ParE family toxin [Vibrio nigripulchritudo]|uniref:type II toxin-antitoxin system RelE/ParE family toxin n=1 Tax=Vibrio nigripulchritudo TaxID=28173 RepID=UPI001F365800|nr:type II toxin-antitoxin system RelE/ParE family toxin [Vibrio nigripulchritudo]
MLHSGFWMIVVRLSEFPQMGKKGRIKGTRELVAWSNYIIVYQDTNSTLRVLRILHAAQQWPLDNK